MLTVADQLGAIQQVAVNIEGLDTFLFSAMISFVVFLALVIVIERITLNVQSKRFAINNTNNNTNNVQEDNMNKEVNNKATVEVVEELTLRERTHQIVDKIFDKAESIRNNATARWNSVKSWFGTKRDQVKDITEDIVIGAVYYGVCVPAEAFDEKVNQFKSWQKARAEAAAEEEARAEEERIHIQRTECGYYLLADKLEEMERTFNSELNELKLKLDPTRLPEAKALKLKAEVAKLVAEADEILKKDRTKALHHLREVIIARNYEVPTDVNFVTTKKRLLELVA